MQTVHPAQLPLSAFFSSMGWSETSDVLVETADQKTSQVADRPWVLCVDDDEEFSHGLKLRLQKRGYDVVRAFRGMDGYQCAFEFSPAVILLDLNLPNLCGEEVLSQLRFHPSTAHIPVAIVTGMNQPGLDQKMLSLGASDFFRKPVDFARLARVIDRYASTA